MTRKHESVTAVPTAGRFARSASRSAFLAALSVYTASGAMAQSRLANPGDAPAGGVQYDFRCTASGAAGCPLVGTAGTSDPLTFELPGLAGGYLEFTNENTSCSTPGVSSTFNGAGATCTEGNFFEGGSAAGEAEAPLGWGTTIGDAEILSIKGCAGDPSTAVSCTASTIDEVKGVYIAGVEAINDAAYGGGDFCRSDEGTVEVFFDDGGTMDSDTYFWSIDGDGGEGYGGCIEEGEQTIFVGFPFLPDGALVKEIKVEVSDLVDDTDGVYVLGTEDCGGAGGSVTFGGQCEISLYEGITPFPDGDLRVRAAPEAVISLVPGFPIRVQDTRDICQAGADLGLESPEPLVIDGSAMAFDVTGAPVTGAPLPLGIDSDTAPTEFFTLADKTCGIPRVNSAVGVPDPLGDPIERDEIGGTGWTPFVDIAAITTDIEFDPVADTTEWRTSDLDFEPGGSGAGDIGVYACQTTAIFSGEADEDQPLFQINARFDEIKYVKEMAGGYVLDPVGRDIMVGCGGSKRGISRRWSFLGYNAIHVPNYDFVTGTRDELDTLEDTIVRLQSCIDATFYSRELIRRIRRASKYYGIFERYRDRSTRVAERYLDRTRWELQDLGFVVESNRGQFGTCWTTAASNFVDIRATDTPDPTDKPLNGFGDIISQVEHAVYVIRAFEDKLLGL